MSPAQQRAYQRGKQRRQGLRDLAAHDASPTLHEAHAMSRAARHALSQQALLSLRLRSLGRQSGRPRRMWPPSQGWKAALWTRQHGRCQYCCASLLPRYHLDHIHPKSQGGPNHLSNYCWACEPCNLKKSARSAIDYTLSLLQ